MANKFDHLTATERASAPSTPDTGDWRLYFKSDGLYVVDDAGTETGPFGPGGSASTDFAYVVEHGATAATARPDYDGVVFWIGTVDPDNALSTDVVLAPPSATLFDRNIRTAGDVAVTSTTWADVDNSLDVTLDVAVGDVVAISVNGKWKGGEAENGRMNVYTVNRGGQIVNATGGIVGWQGPASAEANIGAPFFYEIVADDISAGQATFRLRALSIGGATRTIKASTNDPLHFAAHVIA